MRVLITGASGNVGRGTTALLRQAGHDVVLYDVVPVETDLPFYQGDLQTGENLAPAVQGCDVIVHAAAWHGIHMYSKSEVDYWRLNVDGTFYVFQAALQAKVPKVVYLSSQVIYWKWGKYGFTKAISEELCEYYWRNHKIKYIALRPGDFTPWRKFAASGERLLYGGVDRRDVLQAIHLAVENDTLTNEWFNIVAEPVFSEEEVARWEADGPRILNSRMPGAAELAAKHGINISRKPAMPNVEKTKELLGWKPQHNFLAFMRSLEQLDKEGTVEQQVCDY